MNGISSLMKKFGLRVLFVWHGLLMILVTFVVLEVLHTRLWQRACVALVLFLVLKLLKFKHDVDEDSVEKGQAKEATHNRPRTAI